MTDEPVTESRVEAARKALFALMAEGYSGEEAVEAVDELVQAVSEKARDEERRALEAIVAERDAAAERREFTDLAMSEYHKMCVSEVEFQPHDAETFDEVFTWTLRWVIARLAASPTEEANRAL